jgi:hypothetical protein
MLIIASLLLDLRVYDATNIGALLADQFIGHVIPSGLENALLDQGTTRKKLEAYNPADSGHVVHLAQCLVRCEPVRVGLAAAD